MGLTERGRRVVASCLVVACFAALFRDPVLGVGFVALVVFVGWRWVRARGDAAGLGGLVVFEPGRVEDSIVAGRESRTPVLVSSSFGGEVSLGSDLGEVSLEPASVAPGRSTVAYSFRPVLSGEYSSRVVRVGFVDGFGLFSGGSEVGFGQSFRVYPRVLEAALEAAEFLVQSDTFGMGELVTRLRGSGFEYADSRPYSPGVSLRHMDWKATARTGELIGKEFYLEGGIGVHVVYEAVAPDPVSRDELSASFLRVVTVYARMDSPFGLTVYDGSGVLYSGDQLPHQLAVAWAMRYALRSAGVDVGVLYEVLDPASALVVRRFFDRLGGAGFPEVDALRGVGSVVDGFAARDVENLKLTVVSSVGDPVPLVELARLARMRGWGVELLQPSRPWVRGVDLGHSVELWRYYDRVFRVLERGGVKVSSSVEEIGRDLSEAPWIARRV